MSLELSFTNVLQDEGCVPIHQSLIQNTILDMVYSPEFASILGATDAARLAFCVAVRASVPTTGGSYIPPIPELLEWTKCFVCFMSTLVLFANLLNYGS